MAHPVHHAESSARRYGGNAEDYLPIHNFMDSSKAHVADWRHRAIFHHSFGIYIAELLFGTTIRVAGGKEVPTRFVAEQHVREDMCRIPAASDWLRAIPLERWMAPHMPLSEVLENSPTPEALEAFELGGLRTPRTARLPVSHDA